MSFEFGKEQKDLVNKNYLRMQEARDRKEPVLEKLFEKRMNEALDEFGDLCKFRDEQGLSQVVGDVAIEGSKAA